MASEREVVERVRLAKKKWSREITGFCKKHPVPNMDIEDVVEELLVVLWLCCKSYDPDRGASFRTMFWQAVRNRHASLLRAATRKRRSGMRVESLSEESVACVVDNCLNEPSAEEHVLAHLEIRSRLSA